MEATTRGRGSKQKPCAPKYRIQVFLLHKRLNYRLLYGPCKIIHPIQLITVFSIMHHTETVTIHTSQEDFFHLFNIMQFVIESCHVSCFISHLCSHPTCQGISITEGCYNRLLDTVTVASSAFNRFLPPIPP